MEVYQPVVFSMIMTGARLTNAQRQPHLDGGITGLIYLTSDEYCTGGTALYRHRLTGLERIPVSADATMMELARTCDIDPESLRTPAGYKSFLDTIIFNPLFAAKGNSYVNDGNEFWELLHLAKMKFNRLAIIDGRIPHSQYMREDDFRDHARLTQTLYLKESS